MSHYRPNKHPQEGEDALGYRYDEAVKRTKGLLLPTLTTSSGRPKKLDPKVVLADALILPRDYDSKYKVRLKMLQVSGAADVPLPPGARTSMMSLNRHVAATQWDAPASAVSIRDQIEKELKDRDVVVYMDRDLDQPVRVAVVPPFTRGDVQQMFERAGYPTKVPKEPDTAMGTIGLLTNTSKMGCYSFNLPAGPPKLGGTCPASTIGFMYSPVGELLKAQKGKRDKNVVIDPETFICNGCYAIKNAYGNPSIVLEMGIRLYLVEKLMKNEGKGPSSREAQKNLFVVSAEDYRDAKPRGKTGRVLKSGTFGATYPNLAEGACQPLAVSFSELIVAAFTEARIKVSERRAKLEHFGYTAAEYQRTQDIETWHWAKKRVKRSLKKLPKSAGKARAKLEAQIAADVVLANASVDEFTSTRPKYKKVYANWQLPDPGYFRIHDAGDMYSDPYFRAWLDVCRHFADDVRFWAPTRMWAFAGTLRDVTLKEVPENLALRPSTLHFRDEAPTSAYLHNTLKLPAFKKGRGGGLSAASGSAPETPTKKDYKCPAYEHWTGGGGAIRLDPRSQKGVGGTCITARGPNGEHGCRACWNGSDGRYHDLVVFYEEH